MQFSHWVFAYDSQSQLLQFLSRGIEFATTSQTFCTYIVEFVNAHYFCLITIK